MLSPPAPGGVLEFAKPGGISVRLGLEAGTVASCWQDRGCGYPLGYRGYPSQDSLSVALLANNLLLLPEDAVGKFSGAVLRGRVCNPSPGLWGDGEASGGKMTQPLNFSAFERILFIG